MEFSIIAACDSQRGLGKAGTIPWHLKPDMDRFRRVTSGAQTSGQTNVVIMGKTTWRSLPESYRPLPHRHNIVLSPDTLELPAGVVHATSFDEALQQAQAIPDHGEIFVIGGGSVYAQTIADPRCTRIFLTEIDHDYQCDTFFPSIPENFHRIMDGEDVTAEGLRYRFIRYERTVQATG